MYNVQYTGHILDIFSGSEQALPLSFGMLHTDPLSNVYGGF